MFKAFRRIRHSSRWTGVGFVIAGIIAVALPAVARAADPQSLPNFQLPKTLDGHKNKIWCVAFSPDGKSLASGSAGFPAELKLWDLAAGESIATVAAPSSVRWVAFSADGEHLATAEHDNTAKLRDPTSGKVVHELAGHASGLDAVVFSPNGKRFATGSWDKTVRIWDAESGKRQMVLEGHQEPVLTVAYSPDGKIIASASAEWGDPEIKRPTDPSPGQVKLWDSQTGKEMATLVGHTDRVFSIAFSPDGKLLATASFDRTIKLWQRQ